MRKNKTTERNIDCFILVIRETIQLMKEFIEIPWFVRIFTSCTNLQSLTKANSLIIYLLSALLPLFFTV